MGLDERRKIKELQETTFPGRVKDLGKEADGMFSDGEIRELLTKKL